MLNAKEIMDLIPHRYPFLLVDRIEEIEVGKSAVGTKNVTINEPFFQGHFPGLPIMPGVLIVEALAQVGAVAIKTMPENKDKLAVFAGIEDLRFKRQVIPGDTLRLVVHLTQLRSRIGVAEVEATVGDELACKGKIMFALVEGDQTK